MEIFSARDKTPITGRSATPLTLSVNTLPGSLAGLATLSLLSMILATSTWAFTTDKDSTIGANLTVTGGLSVKGNTASTTDALTVNGDTVTVRNLIVEGTFDNSSTNPAPGDGSTSPSSPIVLGDNDTFQIKEGGGNSILSALTNGNIGIGNFTDPLINLAIGDSDTGFKSDRDGELQIYSNNGQRMIITNDDSGTQSRIGIGDFRVPQINLAMGDDDTGFNSAGDGKLQIYSNNGQRMIITNDDSGTQSRIGIGDFTVPQINLAIGDNDTGLHSPDDGILQFYTNNTKRMRITQHGTVQIGDSVFESGDHKLMVDGKIDSTDQIEAPSLQLKAGATNNGRPHINESLYFSEGKVGVKATHPDTELHVEGTLKVQNGDIILDYGNFTLNNGGNINLGSDKIKLDSNGNINLGNDKITLNSNGNIAVVDSGSITLGNFTVSKNSNKTLLRVDEIQGAGVNGVIDIPKINESEIDVLTVYQALVEGELIGPKFTHAPQSPYRHPIEVVGGITCFYKDQASLRVPCDRLHGNFFGGSDFFDERLLSKKFEITSDDIVLDRLYGLKVYALRWEHENSGYPELQEEEVRYRVSPIASYEDDWDRYGLPDLIGTTPTDDEYKTVDYYGLTALLVQGLRELYDKVRSTRSSDRRLKSNIQPIENALDKLQQINGVHFDWKDPERQARESAQVGVIAQDVEAVFPELIGEGKDGYKTVDYSKLSAVLIEAVKELKQQNASLAARLEALEAQR